MPTAAPPRSWPHRSGAPAPLRMALLAEPLSAADALSRRGSSPTSSRPDSFDASVERLARRLASGPPLAFAATKKAINAATLLPSGRPRARAHRPRPAPHRRRRRGHARLPSAAGPSSAAVNGRIETSARWVESSARWSRVLASQPARNSRFNRRKSRFDVAEVPQLVIVTGWSPETSCQSTEANWAGSMVWAVTQSMSSWRISFWRLQTTGRWRRPKPPPPDWR